MIEAYAKQSSLGGHYSGPGLADGPSLNRLVPQEGLAAGSKKDLLISEELQQLQAALNELESAQSALADSLMPILFFGPECGSNAIPESPPGSDMARNLFEKKMQVLRCVAFLRNIHSKVNL